MSHCISPEHVCVCVCQEFIEEILAPPFGGMVTFVKESEALMEKGQLDKLKNDEGKDVSPALVQV